MPTTRKKVIKTVYKDENDSEEDKAAGDFSDSGSEAEIPDQSSSEDEVEEEVSSSDEFDKTSTKKPPKAKSLKPVRKTQSVKELLHKVSRQSNTGGDLNEELIAPIPFSVKDLTEEDKLLPSFLNLSESDSSDDESHKAPSKKTPQASTSLQYEHSDSENESQVEYKDVWSHSAQENSEEIAKKTFMELEKHKSEIEKTKASIINYEASKRDTEKTSNVKDLLALGEETLPSEVSVKKGKKSRKVKKDDSDSEIEDWEEVKDAKTIPQQGIQLVVDFPEAGCRKTKKLDVEMMMKRKINRVKKEYQVYMHKVHVLCWLGHGNYVSRVLNDQEIMAAAISLVPSKDCYPGERVDMKYLEQITTWFKDKLTLKQDKNEDKFRPKAPPLKEILLAQLKFRTVTAKKYLVYIFVSMLRAIGLQCRIMFNFVTLPIKPPSSELCSLSTKQKETKKAEGDSKKEVKKELKIKSENTDKKIKRKLSKGKIPQVDGVFDDYFHSDSDIDNIIQLDGNDDALATKAKRSTRSINKNTTKSTVDEDVSPPKRARKSPTPKTTKVLKKDSAVNGDKEQLEKRKRASKKVDHTSENMEVHDTKVAKRPSPRKTRTASKTETKVLNATPKITITNEKNTTKTLAVASKYFGEENTKPPKNLSLRKRSQTTKPTSSTQIENNIEKVSMEKTNARTRSAPGPSVATSKYFDCQDEKPNAVKISRSSRLTKKEAAQEDKHRVSHRDLIARNKAKPKNDVTGDLVEIIKSRVREAKEESKMGKVKGKVKQESDDDSDHLPVEKRKRRKSGSDDDFKPTKISPKPRPSTSRKIDRRVLSSDSEEIPQNKCNVWCEVFVEELEQWISVDVIRAKIHCPNEIYSRATHPVCYVVGWDNNNYLKDLTRRYVPHWNTVTRKQRAEPSWWATALQPWLAPRSPRDIEEDEQLNRMQLEAPLPKSIAEYKNHPLYALKRHLLKFEAIYPPDAATLGFVRGEAVYARECVYVCRSRDTWLKEAKVVKLGEEPYKVVKARPKWDRLSNKMITDKPLEVFGPWQVQDYEPPEAKDGVVPRNAYGNVELFKDCMLPKGTVHIKLPGLNRVAKKLNIDCAPAMTGFDFNGGWSHPVYDGFVVCTEYEQIITEAWLKDQEDQERREREKIDARVYGNWRRLIKGLLIKERLKDKYGFVDPAPADTKKKRPKLVVKKK